MAQIKPFCDLERNESTSSQLLSPTNKENDERKKYNIDNDKTYGK